MSFDALGVSHGPFPMSVTDVHYPRMPLDNNTESHITYEPHSANRKRTSGTVDTVVDTELNASVSGIYKSNWTVQTKKHKLNNPPTFKVNNDKTISKQFIATANKFDSLYVDEPESEMDGQQTDTNELVKPKPIFITFESNIYDLFKLIDTVACNEYTYKLENKNQIRLMPKTIKMYSVIAKLLEQHKLNFYTFQLTQNRCFRVVLKGMHHTIDLDDLKIDIEQQGHKVVRIHNIRHRLSRVPLNMFFVDLEQRVNNKNIFELKFLLNAKIVFEAPYAKKEIVQCQRCQRYGHSKTYCRHLFRCVKCAQNHPTSECAKKDRTSPAKCALCDGAHPANYRGCAVYKEIQSRKYPTEKVTSATVQPRPNTVSINKSPPKVSSRDPRQFNRPQPTYAQIAITRQPQPTYAQIATVGQPDTVYAQQNRSNIHDYGNAETYTSQNQRSPDTYISRLENIILRQSENQMKLSEDIRTIMNLLTTLIAKLH